MARDDALEALASQVIDLSFKLHRDLGPGLLESAYEVFLHEQLLRAGVECKRQVSISAQHDGIFVENAFKIDLLVADRLIVELKSVERLQPVHAKQVLTYLRLTDRPLGLLVNFGAALFKDGVKRVVNNYR